MLFSKHMENHFENPLQLLIDLVVPKAKDAITGLLQVPIAAKVAAVPPVPAEQAAAQRRSGGDQRAGSHGWGAET